MAIATDNRATVTYAAAVQLDAYTVRASLDARGWRSVSFTIVGSVQTTQWTVYGANDSAYADEVVVQAEADIAAAAIGSYAVSPAPYDYYRVKVRNKVGGVIGTVAIRGVAK